MYKRQGIDWARDDHAVSIVNERGREIYRCAVEHTAARAWLHVIWHCWQDGLAYDPAQHRALQRVLATQTDAA